MKIIYHITPHRVIHCQVHLRAHISVEKVLQAAIWFPRVLRVHIETQECCSSPEFALETHSPLIDPRLSRFVALENDCFEVICGTCKAHKQVQSVDTSLLHWRSRLEMTCWKGLPWFPAVTTNSTVTVANGMEEQWCGQSVIVNQAPSVRAALAAADFTRVFLDVVTQVRACVHPRLLPFMNAFPDQVGHQTRVFVALRNKRQDGFWFLVKRKPKYVTWPRYDMTNDDTYTVQTAAKVCESYFTLERFMQSVVQVVPTGEREWLFVVNCPVVDIVNYNWVHETRLHSVHGLPTKLPWCQMALGMSTGYKLFHGTSREAASLILEQGFKSSAIHDCPGTYYKCDPPHACCCKGMLGPGVYLASFNKAASNAGRVTGPHQYASVLECWVTAGEVKVVTPWSNEHCKCGCNSRYSDHTAFWYHEQLFDYIVLMDGAGVKRMELCVRRPGRVVASGEHLVKFNENRELVFNSANSV